MNIARLFQDNVIETIVYVEDMVSNNKITLDTSNVEAFDNELLSPDIKSEIGISSIKQKVKRKDIEDEKFENGNVLL